LITRTIALHNKEVAMRRFDPLRHQLPKLLTSVLFFGLLFTTTLRAATFEIPPFNNPPSTEHHVGKVVWADLVTPDLAAAEKFYGGLFGWTFHTIRAGDSDYAVAMFEGRPVGGLMQKSIADGEHQQSAWLTFIAVRDVDAVKRMAVAHKAKVLVDSRSYNARGRQAVLADPEGAVFAIVASSSGDSPDYLASPGEWIWSSLHAKDPGTEAAFYQDLFGYDVFDIPSDDGLEHVILSTDDFARASANALPDGSSHRHAHWLNFIRVDSAADMAAKAVSMGGRILVEPHPDRHGGMVAVIADPAGAPLGVMEWTVSDTKVEPK
jgi:predicted enzyme related to lactoylglutathione lyase